MNGTSIHVVAPSGVQSFDPARATPGMPPNFGQPLIPHVVTFQGLIGSAANVYRPSDEALKHSWENARFMRNDLAIMECVEMRQRSTALLDWHLEVDDEDDPVQASLRDELSAIIRAIPYFTRYRECLANAIWYGKYAVKHRYQWMEINGRWRVGVEDWGPVHGDKLVYRYDDATGEYDPKSVGIRVGVGTSTGATADHWRERYRDRIEPADWGMAIWLTPPERDMLCIHTHMLEDGEYEEPINAGRIHGIGIRSRIYWTWYQKQEALAWLMEFLERSALGLEVWYYPMGNVEAEKQTRRAAEERVGQGRNIVLFPRMPDQPNAYGMEKIEPSMAGAEVLKSILMEYFGHQIKRYVLGQTLTTEASPTGLGSNLAGIHLDTYLQIIRYDAVNLAETLTRELVRPLQKFNWPRLLSIPVRFVIETETPDIKDKLHAYREVWEMGAKLRAKDLMDLVGAAIPSEADEVLVKAPGAPQGVADRDTLP